MLIRTATLCLVILAGGWCAAARAHDPGREPPERARQQQDEARALLATLPAEARAVVVINRAARQRLNPSGRSLIAMLEELSREDGDRHASFRRLSAAWLQLSSLLGLDPQQAFDALLGGQAILVLRDFDSPTRTGWALASEISAETERQLHARLRPALRMYSCKMPVLALENGRYELTITRPPAGGGQPRPSLLLLAPADEAALFDEMLRVLCRASQPSRPGPPHPVDFHAARRGVSADVLFVLRGSEGAGGFVSIAASQAADGWTATLLSTPGMLWGAAESAAAVEPWSAGAFDHLQAGALIATMGVSGLASAPAAPAWLRLAPGVASSEALGPRAGVVVRKVDGPAAHALSGGPQMARPPGAVRPQASVERRESAVLPGPLVSVTLALETPDLESTIDLVDARVAMLAPALEAGRSPMEAWELAAAASPARAPVDDLRVLRVEASSPGQTQSLFGPDPELTWGYARAADAAPAPRGWCVMTLAPEGAAGSRATREALAGLSRAESRPLRPWMSLGVLRPAGLAMLSGLVDSPTSLRPLRWIELVRWEAWLGEDARSVEGSLVVRMNVRGMRAAGPPPPPEAVSN